MVNLVFILTISWVTSSLAEYALRAILTEYFEICGISVLYQWYWLAMTVMFFMVASKFSYHMMPLNSYSKCVCLPYV